MEEIINKIFKEKYPNGLSDEYTKEEIIGYMMAINDIKEQLTLTDVSHCFSDVELNIIRQWGNNTIDHFKDDEILSIEWKLIKKIHEKLNMQIESRVKKNCG